MANHYSILAWKIPWTEEPGGLQSIGSQESDTVTKPPPPVCFLGLKCPSKGQHFKHLIGKFFKLAFLNDGERKTKVSISRSPLMGNGGFPGKVSVNSNFISYLQ